MQAKTQRVRRTPSWAAIAIVLASQACSGTKQAPGTTTGPVATNTAATGTAAQSGGGSGPSGAPSTASTGASGASTAGASTGTPAAGGGGTKGDITPAGTTDAGPSAPNAGNPATQTDAGTTTPDGEVTGDTSQGPVNAWLRMGYDHTNRYFNPVETTISVATAPMLKQKWSFEVAGYPPGSPVVVNGRVYALATGGLYALDLETGTQIWSRTDIVGTSSVAYQDGAIFVHANSTGDKLVGQLHKLNAADGKTLWGPIVTYDLENCDGTSSPMLADGKVIVGHGCGVRELALDGTNKGPRGGVEAFSQQTGDHVWTYWSVPEMGEDGAMSWSTQSIDMEEKAVFVSTGNNYTVGGPDSDAIHKVDLATGMRLWVTQVRADDVWGLTTGNVKDTDFGANPILVEIDGQKIVAAGDKGAAFWAMDRTTGKLLWGREMLTPSRAPATGGVLNNGASDGKFFYVASNDAQTGTSTLFKLDPKTGADVWTKHFDKLVWGGLSLANGVLVAPINDDLYVMNAETGDVLTMFNTGGTTAGGAAAIVQGKIIVKSGLSYALNNTVLPNNKIICYALP